MRKITAGLFIALDGVAEAPDQWHFPFFNDEMGEIVGAQMQASDAMLLGRTTYQEFAGFWPNQSSDDPFAAQMNGTQKYVVSNTLRSADWQNTTIISGDITGQLSALKEQEGKSISIVGSMTLTRTLLRDGLLDELHLLVHPIVVGKGKRLFPEEFEQIPLKLASSRTLSTGVLYLVYERATEPAATGA